MFLKTLSIKTKTRTIREIAFHKGLNLIIDETLTDNVQESGNNVGKTTVLRLIDFCLGGDGKNIYRDPEFPEKSNTQIESFLKTSNIVIGLVLAESLDDDSSEIKIKRNFLTGKERIQEINEEPYNNIQFESKLKELIFRDKSNKTHF